MLEYSMSEIGPVVAELQLEEDYSGDEYDDDMDWVGSDVEDDEETDDDAEDELGRSKRSVITPDYIKRMQELEKRLNVQSAFNVGRAETKPRKPDEGIGRIAVVGASSPASDSPTAPGRQKNVSSASESDAVPEPTPRPPADGRPKARKIADVGDVVEKTTEPETLTKEPEGPPKRVSRFKKERAVPSSLSPSPASSLPPGPHQVPASFLAAQTARAAPPAEPTPPEHEIVANTIVERPPGPDPGEPDELDDAVLYKAAAAEYNRLRNRLIQKQGGFAQQDGAIDSESGLVPLDEELGGPKRMSKFKAARLAKLQ
jgi:unconventional prefoldin RPB5 interactor 1